MTQVTSLDNKHTLKFEATGGPARIDNPGTAQSYPCPDFDVCDCEDRCDKCGRKKKKKIPYYYPKYTCENNCENKIKR